MPQTAMARTARRHKPASTEAQALARESWRLLPHTHGAIASEGTWKPFKHLQFIGRSVARAIASGNGRLLITLPPGHGKSEFISHRVPAWYLDLFPSEHVLFASYSDAFALEWGRKARDSVGAFSGSRVKVRQDSSSVSHWLTTDGGGMVSVGIGGALTGRRGPVAIVDDPIKNWQEAKSELHRRRTREWFDSVLLSRLSDGGTTIVLMTRWHPKDLAGYLISKGGWEHIRLPALAEANDPLGRKEGEALCPELFRQSTLEYYKANRPRFIWEGQYQQRPSVPEGSIIQRNWLGYYDKAPEKFETVVQSWDCAFKGEQKSDYVVGQVWGRKGATFDVLDQIRARLSFTETITAIKRLTDKWPQATGKLIEEKANGSAVIDVLKREVYGLIPINPKDDKVARLNAVSPLFQAGNVRLPRNASWARDFEEELLAFPAVVNDDQVDACTQALSYLSKRRPSVMWTGGGAFA